jgi:hypothetical protein
MVNERAWKESKPSVQRNRLSEVRTPTSPGDTEGQFEGLSSVYRTVPPSLLFVNFLGNKSLTKVLQSVRFDKRDNTENSQTM